jgi:cytochrome c biogenesis protein CcdA
MIGLSVLVASIGLADSVNPSTVIPGLWLAAASGAAVLASFTVGVFAMYMGGGLVLVLGPGPLLIHAVQHLQGTVEHVVEAAVGVAALTFAVVLLRSRQRESWHRHRHRTFTPASAFVLGAGIMVIELPTALMYFGAISAMLAGHASIPLQITLLFVYNVLFVAPLIALLMIRAFAGDRADQWLNSAERWLQQLGQVVVSGVAGIAGAALLTVGVVGLLMA